jgi:hypothetical protein
MSVGDSSVSRDVIAWWPAISRVAAVQLFQMRAGKVVPARLAA